MMPLSDLAHHLHAFHGFCIVVVLTFELFRRHFQYVRRSNFRIELCSFLDVYVSA